VRALTVRQPWAWAIVHGGKDVENRSRNVAGEYRGPVAIHAGLNFEKDNEASRAHHAAHGTEKPTELKFGAVIGVVDLVGVHEAVDSDLGQGLRGVCCTSPWGQSDAGVHLVLANPRPLPRPVPAKGRLGLWTPDPDLYAAITDQLKETR